MSILRSETRVGLTGGRRVNIGELAKNQETRQKLENLLALMDSIEQECPAESIADNGPEVPKQTQQAEPA